MSEQREDGLADEAHRRLEAGGHEQDRVGDELEVTQRVALFVRAHEHRKHVVTGIRPAPGDTSPATMERPRRSTSGRSSSIARGVNAPLTNRRTRACSAPPSAIIHVLMMSKSGPSERPNESGTPVPGPRRASRSTAWQAS